MSELIIRSDLANRIRKIAEQRDQAVDEFLESLLDTVSTPAPTGTLAALAEAADQADIRLAVSDVADRSRDILNDEYAKRAARWLSEE